MASIIISYFYWILIWTKIAKSLSIYCSWSCKTPIINITSIWKWCSSTSYCYNRTKFISCISVWHTIWIIYNRICQFNRSRLINKVAKRLRADSSGISYSYHIIITWKICRARITTAIWDSIWCSATANVSQRVNNNFPIG